MPRPFLHISEPLSKKDGRAELAGLSEAKTEGEGADGSRTLKLAIVSGRVMRFFVGESV